MFCAECGCDLVQVTGPLEEQIRGEDYTIENVTRWECPKCHEYTIEAAEGSRLSRELWNRYRRAHGLLSPDDIRHLRVDVLGLQQAEFGRLVHANVQTVSRWENGRVVQDDRANELMRLLRDVPEARTNLLERAELLHASRSTVVFSGSSHSLPVSQERPGGKTAHASVMQNASGTRTELRVLA